MLSWMIWMSALLLCSHVARWTCAALYRSLEFVFTPFLLSCLLQVMLMVQAVQLIYGGFFVALFAVTLSTASA
jgi:hypothetical protein